jgi:amino acid transporter
MMMFFLVVAVIYNMLFARLLMVSGIDGHLPIWIAKINKNRVPAHAIQFQTILGVIFTVIVFFVVPSLTFLGNPANLTNEVYLVTAAGLLLVWALSFLFPFIDLAILLSRGSKDLFKQRLMFPKPILAICIVIGPVVCIATIIDTLIYSWAPPLLTNTQWLTVVGTFTLICLTFCIVGSMFASSQAEFEGFGDV